MEMLVGRNEDLVAAFAESDPDSGISSQNSSGDDSDSSGDESTSSSSSSSSLLSNISSSTSDSSISASATIPKEIAAAGAPVVKRPEFAIPVSVPVKPPPKEVSKAKKPPQSKKSPQPKAKVGMKIQTNKTPMESIAEKKDHGKHLQSILDRCTLFHELPEVRGSMELKLLQNENAVTRPMEMEEQNLPAEFDAKDSAESDTLRLLTDFYFCKEDGTPVSLDILELDPEKRPKIIGFGTAVQPLSANEISTLVMSTPDLPLQSTPTPLPSPQKKPGGAAASEEGDSLASPPKKKQKLSEGESAEIGSLVASDEKNGMSSRPATPPSTSTKTNSRSPSYAEELKLFEEKLELQSADYVANLAVSQRIVLESGFIIPPSCKKQRVYLPNITEWCLDYTPGDPTLWVITPRAWYKIAGPISGAVPHDSYRKHFSKARKMFEASFTVANVLRDFLPNNKKLSYRTTMNEVVTQSSVGRYPISSDFLIENCDFITSQIADLDQDDSRRTNSMFFRQLKRLREFQVARLEKEKKKKEAQVERKMLREKQKEQRLLKLEEEKKQKEKERLELAEAMKYPMEDIALLQEELGPDAETKAPPRPSPTEKEKHPPRLLGDVIMIWQIISAFSQQLQVQTTTLETLFEMFECSEGPVVYLTDTIVAMIGAILDERPLISQDRPELADVSAFKSNYRKLYGLKDLNWKAELNHMTWQEILRKIVAREALVDGSIGLFDPLPNAEVLIHLLFMQKQSGPFLQPVKAEEVANYYDVVRTPMDLGTIEKRLQDGHYERLLAEPGGLLTNESIERMQAQFVKDVRLIWDNAIRFNGEESEMGKLAANFSEIFEFELKQLVTDPLTANRARIASRERLSATCINASGGDQAREVEERCIDSTKITPADIVDALSLAEFEKLPTSFKIATLAWLCTEFLQLNSSRALIEANLNVAIKAHEEYQREEKEDENMRCQWDKSRRQMVEDFQKRCAAMDIDVTDAETFEKLPDTVSFMEQVKANEQLQSKELDRRKNARIAKRRIALGKCSMTLEPLGSDRYHNRYWMFQQDHVSRIFVENGKDGSFSTYTSAQDLENLMQWLNPKGRRETVLLDSLKDCRERYNTPQVPVESNSTSYRLLRNPSSAEASSLAFFPDEASKLTLFQPSDDELIKQQAIFVRMLLVLEEYLCHDKINHSKWSVESRPKWIQDVKSAKSIGDLQACILKLEQVARKTSNAICRPEWERKLQEWTSSVHGCKTFAQLFLLTKILMLELADWEALIDLTSDLDRRSFLKLREKASRADIPEIGQNIVYFGKGHAQAIAADKKSRHFVQPGSDALDTTIELQVKDISYHPGGGDPYARVSLTKASEERSIRHDKLICDPMSKTQKLSRILLRIVKNLEQKAIAEPFLELVDKRSFPDYYEIVASPIALSTIKEKVEACEYTQKEELTRDIQLLVQNCELFCSGRFPDLPLLAHDLFELYQQLLRKYNTKLLKLEETLAAETLAQELLQDVVLDEPLVVILRLENRLPDFVIDVDKYNQVIKFPYSPGDRFQMSFRETKGIQLYEGLVAGSSPMLSNGLAPWEVLRVIWEDEDGSLENTINPWEMDFTRQHKRSPIR